MAMNHKRLRSAAIGAVLVGIFLMLAIALTNRFGKPPEFIYKALLGGAAAAMLFAVIELLRWIRSAFKSEVVPTQPLTRGEMLARLQQIVSDETASPEERTKAANRLQGFKGSGGAI